jgi:hypothetical protein
MPGLAASMRTLLHLIFRVLKHGRPSTSIISTPLHFLFDFRVGIWIVRLL